MKSTTRGRKVEDRNHGFLIHFNASLRLEEEFLFAKLCIWKILGGIIESEPLGKDPNHLKSKSPTEMGKPPWGTFTRLTAITPSSGDGNTWKC